MKRGTKLFLLAGCALVLWIDLPATVIAVAAGWRGPYANRAADARAAKLVAEPRAAEQLARR